MPEKLTGESAKKFALETFKKMKSGVEKRFLIQHSKSIVKTSMNLAKGRKIDIESLKIACWLHDIGRTVQIEGHANISLKLAKEKFGELNPIIEDCIVNHSSSKNPGTKEGKIMQLADKLSIMNDFKLFKIIFAKEKYKEKGLEMVGYVGRDLLEVLKRYNWEEK